MLLMKAFKILSEHISKTELKYLLHKIRLSGDRITEVEKAYPDRGQFKDRVYHGRYTLIYLSHK